MLRYAMFGLMVVGSALLVAGVDAGSAAKSGPKPARSPGPFHPLNVTGAPASRACIARANPVAVVFAAKPPPRSPSSSSRLTKPRSECKAEMGSYAVFCNDKDGSTRRRETRRRPEVDQARAVDRQSGRRRATTSPRTPTCRSALHRISK